MELPFVQLKCQFGNIQFQPQLTAIRLGQERWDGVGGLHLAQAISFFRVKRIQSKSDRARKRINRFFLITWTDYTISPCQQGKTDLLSLISAPHEQLEKAPKQREIQQVQVIGDGLKTSKSSDYFHDGGRDSKFSVDQSCCCWINPFWFYYIQLFSCFCWLGSLLLEFVYRLRTTPLACNSGS